VNFVFISPNYPENYWMFCAGLKKYGARVLAIVDQPYNSLKPELKQNVDECYVVSSFHDYDQMLRAVAYFTFKYGKIDWIESNNEAWLDLDARLRDDFNVKTGFSHAQIEEFQSKSAMKKYYEKAGLPVAPYVLPDSEETALEFAHRVGYPVVLKPDHGVGASFTYEITNDDEMRKYLKQAQGNAMILEKYIPGDVFTMDGVCDANGKIRLLGSMEYVGNCMDSVSKHDSIGSYYRHDMPENYWQIAQSVIDAFGLKNRFFHGEYFRLTEDVEGVGKKGTIAGLEVNFRPPGGICPDIFNYSNDFNVYEKWAEVMMTQNVTLPNMYKYSAGFAGRRNSINYKYSIQDIENMFSVEKLGTQYPSAALASGMGDALIVARFKTTERLNEFFNKALEKAD
jgi:hypothetical protein